MLSLPPRSDIMAASALYPAVRDAADSGDVAFDCAGVSRFSGAMAQLIAACAKTIDASGRTLSLHNVTDAVREDMAALGFDQHLQKWEHHA